MKNLIDNYEDNKTFQSAEKSLMKAELFVKKLKLNKKNIQQLEKKQNISAIHSVFLMKTDFKQSVDDKTNLTKLTEIDFAATVNHMNIKNPGTSDGEKNEDKFINRQKLLILTQQINLFKALNEMFNKKFTSVEAHLEKHDNENPQSVLSPQYQIALLNFLADQAKVLYSEKNILDDHISMLISDAQ
ncbi:MAG: hypothetical protein M1827_006151 [Pycnora praestabilis]|nr:MAG: hypothetical protein M1827_006151 [Pycnora praestabilis]